MKINLETPKKVIIQEEKSEMINQLTIARIIDSPTQKTVKCIFIEMSETVTLWEGDTYTAIGQWTDADVIIRLNELYNA